MTTAPAKKKKKAAAPKLTLESRKKMLLAPCKTRDELKNWIKYHFGLELPDCRVSRYADTTPLDLVWEVYQICVLKNNPEDISELLFVAGRGSGKTLGMAIAELMILLHDQRDVCHVGAILSQAKRCYEYQTRFLLNDRIRPVIQPPKVPEEDRILTKLNMEKSVFKIDGETITLEVLPCTLKACNGPHVPLVVVDEIDTVSGEGLRAFLEINGMLDTKRGRRPLRVGISTRKSRYGLMNAQIENAEAEGRTVRRWTAFEFTERCPESRSGTEKIDLYIKQDDMDVLTKDEWEKKDVSKKKEYDIHNMYEGCRKCPLAAICLGDAKKQDSKSPMLKSIAELAQKVLSGGADWALAQLMNLKPSVEGIIYREFEEKVHVKSWNEMWRTLTGKDFPGECTHDIFVKKCLDMKLACYGGIDWGWSNPSTVVYFYVDNRENIYVVRCDGMTYVSNPSWIHHIKTKWHNLYRCHLYFPDLANPGDGAEMRKAGLPVASEIDKNINIGVQVIKKWLRTPGSADPKIFFAKETTQHIVNEFNLFHFKTDAAGIVTDDPADEFDHWLDALRYPMTMLFARNSIILSSAGLDYEKDSLMGSNGSYNRAPTASEYATANQLPFNPEQNEKTVKLGKIGTLSQLSIDEEDAGGDGGFIWSF